jgi:TonB-dependent SusC/RagA subfamily outer membrane receptor
MRTSLSGIALSAFMLVAVAGGCASRPGQPGATPPRPQQQDDLSDPLQRLLQHKSPGLVLARSPSGFITATVVQGQTSFYSGTEPLYILDDLPFRPGPNGELAGINPYDIDSIKLLTRPEDVSLYGVRGGNGVILIKTKKAGKS